MSPCEATGVLYIFMNTLVDVTGVFLSHTKLLFKEPEHDTVFLWFLFVGNEDCYFTAVMLKKSRVKLLKTEIIPFPSTSMMRNLLTVQVGQHCKCKQCICLSGIKNSLLLEDVFAI